MDNKKNGKAHVEVGWHIENKTHRSKVFWMILLLALAYFLRWIFQWGNSVNNIDFDDKLKAATATVGSAWDAMVDGAANLVDTAGDAVDGAVAAVSWAVDATVGTADTVVDAATDSASALWSIAEVATKAWSFWTLLGALDIAWLSDVFTDNEAGPYTVLAPTDDAFVALPEGTMTALTQDPTGQLAEILKYHVVDGKVDAASVTGLTTIKTLQWEEISVEVVDGEVVLNGNVKVTATDVEASNGVIHVVDGVLLPPSMNAGDDAAEAPAEPAAATAPAVDAPEWFTYLVANKYVPDTMNYDPVQWDIPVTRATATPLLSKYGQLAWLERDTAADCAFADVAGLSESLLQTIDDSCEFGLLRWANGDFMPSREMKKFEMLATLVRSKQGYLDEENVDPWYQNYVTQSQAMWLIGQVDDSFLQDNIMVSELGEWLSKMDS